MEAEGGGAGGRGEAGLAIRGQANNSGRPESCPAQPRRRFGERPAPAHPSTPRSARGPSSPTQSAFGPAHEAKITTYSVYILIMICMMMMMMGSLLYGDYNARTLDCGEIDREDILVRDG
jgi:hypothetical protein